MSASTRDARRTAHLDLVAALQAAARTPTPVPSGSAALVDPFLSAGHGDAMTLDPVPGADALARGNGAAVAAYGAADNAAARVDAGKLRPDHAAAMLERAEWTRFVAGHAGRVTRAQNPDPLPFPGAIPAPVRPTRSRGTAGDVLAWIARATGYLARIDATRHARTGQARTRTAQRDALAQHLALLAADGRWTVNRRTRAKRTGRVLSARTFAPSRPAQDSTRPVAPLPLDPSPVRPFRGSVDTLAGQGETGPATSHRSIPARPVNPDAVESTPERVTLPRRIIAPHVRTAGDVLAFICRVERAAAAADRLPGPVKGWGDIGTGAAVRYGQRGRKFGPDGQVIRGQRTSGPVRQIIAPEGERASLVPFARRVPDTAPVFHAVRADG